jgi:hypothetical protein
MVVLLLFLPMQLLVGCVGVCVDVAVVHVEGGGGGEETEVVGELLLRLILFLFRLLAAKDQTLARVIMICWRWFRVAVAVAVAVMLLLVVVAKVVAVVESILLCLLYVCM